MAMQKPVFQIKTPKECAIINSDRTNPFPPLLGSGNQISKDIFYEFAEGIKHKEKHYKIAMSGQLT
jgi:hypothetical protein